KIVEFDDRFGQVKVDAAALDPLAIQNLRQLIHKVKVRRQPAEFAAKRGIAFDDGVDVGVSHALRGADHAFVEVVDGDVALWMDLHDTGEDQAFNLGPQAADVGRELERQHGHGAIGKIDGRPTLAGFFIDSGAVFNIVGNVRDVDVEFVIAAGQA